jgi:hypothetical protein
MHPTQTNPTPPTHPTPPTPPTPVTPPASVPVPVAQPVTANEYLASAPPEIRAILTNALEMDKQTKQGLVDRLVMNLTDPTTKQAHHTYLMTKPLTELKMLVSLLPIQNFDPSLLVPGLPGGLQPTMPTAYLPGVMPVSVGGYDAVNGSDDGVLTPPTINWGDNRKSNRTEDE